MLLSFVWSCCYDALAASVGCFYIFVIISSLKEHEIDRYAESSESGEENDFMELQCIQESVESMQRPWSIDGLSDISAAVVCTAHFWFLLNVLPFIPYTAQFLGIARVNYSHG